MQFGMKAAGTFSTSKIDFNKLSLVEPE